MAEVRRRADQGRIDLLALDVDGTLLTSRHEVTPGVAGAVRRATNSGVRVVLTSARPPRGLLPVLAALADPVGDPADATAVEALIASQGALTGRYSSTGELTVLARAPMAARDALALVRGLPPGVTASWFCGERWLVERIDARIEQEASIVGFGPEVVDLADAVDASDPADGPEKLLLLAGPDVDVLDVVAVPAGLQAVRSTATHLEVTRRGVDKATALADLCAAWGIHPSRVAAMGDGRNDLSLLAFAGIALAPGNAAAEVLRAADVVTSSNDDDAVAQAVDLLVRG
jgi:hypothetical protein